MRFQGLKGWEPSTLLFKLGNHSPFSTTMCARNRSAHSHHAICAGSIGRIVQAWKMCTRVQQGSEEGFQGASQLPGCLMRWDDNLLLCMLVFCLICDVCVRWQVRRGKHQWVVGMRVNERQLWVLAVGMGYCCSFIVCLWVSTWGFVTQSGNELPSLCQTKSSLFPVTLIATRCEASWSDKPTYPRPALLLEP